MLTLMSTSEDQFSCLDFYSSNKNNPYMKFTADALSQPSPVPALFMHAQIITSQDLLGADARGKGGTVAKEQKICNWSRGLRAGSLEPLNDTFFCACPQSRFMKMFRAALYTISQGQLEIGPLCLTGHKLSYVAVENQFSSECK